MDMGKAMLRYTIGRQDYSRLFIKREERRAAGLCVVCGGPKDRDGWHCSGCLKKMNGMKAKCVRKKKERGLCANCGNATVDGAWCCPECQKKANAHAVNIRKTRREQGLCPQCGQPADDGYIYCQRCRDIKGEWVRCKRHGIPWENHKRGKLAE
jgi:predicted amidophosphoribosyltransferase